MTKLGSMYPTAARPKGPTDTTRLARTHEGGLGHGKDAKTELFTLAVTNFVGEDTFYETGSKRDERFADLVKAVAHQDPEWVSQFIPWLRNEANMRTASIVAAVEFVDAVDGGRSTLSAALQRADEPGEALAYWRGTRGRKIKAAVKRGIADAAVRLYNPRSFVKWDSAAATYRFGDVIELTHPTPRNADQSALFKRAIDDRHNRERLTEVPGVDGYRNWIRAGAPIDQLPDAATWENVSAHHKMDAKTWEAIIPKMGYMALLRNLRNFEDAGVSDDVLGKVSAKLIDPEEVANSRQLPFRFWSAYKHSGTTRFAHTLEVALDLAVANVPGFPGRTLVMIDTSGSMHAPMSAKSKISRDEAAALFGSIVAARSDGGGLAMYASTVAGVKPQRSILRTTEDVMRRNGEVGHGTNTWPCTAAMWNAKGPFDRVLIFTDMQDHPSRGADFIPAHVPVYVWDLAGYKTANLEVGSGRYLLGGLSDKSFKLVRLLEQGLDAGWPWE